MKSKLLTLILILFTGIGILQAQNVTVTGTVSDASGSPLPGVTIVVKNTAKGASSDFNGNYTIADVAKGETLVFSYVGFITKEVVVGNSNNLNVQLADDTQSVDEVVVIGYGSVKKKDLTGSVSIVDSKTIEKLNPVKIEQALQGTVSGVNVTSQSGAPGAGQCAESLAVRPHRGGGGRRARADGQHQCGGGGRQHAGRCRGRAHGRGGGGGQQRRGGR